MGSYPPRDTALLLEVMPSTMDEIPELEPVLPRRGGPRRRVVALVVGLLLLAGGAALVAGGTFHAGPGPIAPARPDRIAIVDASGGLATIAADGTDRRSYPVPGLVALFPDWSPDGTHVAVVAANETGGAVVVANDRAAGPPAPPTTVFRSALGPIYASWSPNGDRLGVLTNETNGLALRIVRPDGTGAAPIVSQGQPLYWDWVDGTRLLVHVGGNDPGAFLGEVGVDASRGAALTTSVGPFQSPAISAGGRYRAFVAGGTGGPAVVVEASNGSGRHEAAVQGPSAFEWSPRADVLAYIEPNQADLPIGALRTIDASTGVTRRVLDGVVLAYEWSPDGRTIAAIRVVPASTPATGQRAIPTAGVRLVATGSIALELTFVDVAGAAIRSQTADQPARRDADPVHPVLRPVRTQPPALVTGQRRGRPAARRRRRGLAHHDRPGGRLGAAARGRRRGRVLEPVGAAGSQDRVG